MRQTSPPGFKSGGRTVTIKVCVVCAAPFASEGNRRTCSSRCGSELKRATTRAWRNANRERVNALGRESARSRYKSEAAPPIPRNCVMCGADFLATGRGRRVAITCGQACQKAMEHRRKVQRPKDHPTRASDVARATAAKRAKPEKYAAQSRKLLAKRRAELSDSYVADKLGLPAHLARPLVEIKRAQLLLHRELKGTNRDHDQ